MGCDLKKATPEKPPTEVGEEFHPELGDVVASCPNG